MVCNVDRYDDEMWGIKLEEEVEVARHEERMQEIQDGKEVAQEGYGPMSNVLWAIKCKPEMLPGADVGSGEGEEVLASHRADCTDRLRMKFVREWMPDADVWGDWKGFAVASGALEDWCLLREDREAWLRWRQDGEEMPESMQAWNRLAEGWAAWRERNKEGPLPSIVMDASPREVAVDMGSLMQKSHRSYKDGAHNNTPGTHIHNLPDECLINIFRRLHTSDGLRRWMDEGDDVYHPLQCALICKRWHALSEAAVSKICLPFCEFEVDPQQLVDRFKHLTTLSLSESSKAVDPLPLANSTLQLQHFELKDSFQCPVPLMTQALARWSNLRHLELNQYLSTKGNEEIETTLEAVGKLPTLQHLCFTYSGDSLAAACTRVGAISGLTTVELESAQFPPLVEGRFVQVLRKLKLRGFLGAQLPEYLGLFANLESFSVVGAKHLLALPESTGRLSHLTNLQVLGCTLLTSLPSTLGLLSSLQVLEASRLKTWPMNFWHLQALRTLKLSECEDLPDSFCRMTRLGNLVIHNSSVPAQSICSLFHCGHLRVLTLHDFDSLSVSLAGLGMLGGLRELSMNGSGMLNALPDSLGLLTNLERCTIRGFLRLSLLPETVGEWRKLTSLDIGLCSDLKALPEGLGQLPLL